MKHLVWDWNGTLLNDMPLVVSSTNAALVAAGGRPTTEDEHRRDFRRPIIDYYGETLGRVLTQAEFVRLDEVFHDAYKAGLATCDLAGDARTALGTWTGTQSLLSMWFHHELVPTVDGFGLTASFRRIDGLKTGVTGGFKAEHLIVHLKELGVDGSDVVMIGDSVDDADAAAAVGAACVLYSGGFTDPARLRAVGVPVADSLLEAVAIATHQAEFAR